MRLNNGKQNNIQIPKYVEKLLDRREKLASQLISACCEVDEYCERIGVPICDDEACLCTDIMIYCEPWAAKVKTRDAIIKQLEKNRQLRVKEKSEK